MPIVCPTKQGELLFVLEANVGPRWDIFLVQSGGATASGLLDTIHGGMSVLLPQLSWIENFPHSCVLGNPGLYTLPKDLFREIGRQSANDCLQPLVRLWLRVGTLFSLFLLVFLRNLGNSRGRHETQV